MNKGPAIPNHGYGIGKPVARVERLTKALEALGYNEACAKVIAYRKVYDKTLFPNEQVDADAVDRADKIARGLIFN